MNHSKKRNAGLMFEFLVRAVSRSLVDGDSKKSTMALKILRRHFKVGSELLREFKLMNSLIKTTVSSQSVATMILIEARDAAKAYDTKALDREKSLLIRSVNHDLKDPHFYDQHVEEYKTYATIQTLLNEWRSHASRDLGKTAQYEDMIVQRLVADKTVIPTEQAEPQGTSRLVMKIMAKKMNEKYSNSLNEGQRSLIKSYVFSSVTDDPSIIRKKLSIVRNELLDSMTQYATLNGGNTFVVNKLNTARAQLLSESLDDSCVIDDDVIARFMLYTKLHDELGSQEEG